MRLQLGRGRAFDALESGKTNWEAEKDRLGNRGQEKQESKGGQGKQESKGGREGLGESWDSEV